MRFGHGVIRFEFAGIPMVGNLDTGYAIGLTDDGARICDSLLVGEVAADKVSAVDEALMEHLTIGGFFNAYGQPSALTSAYLHVTQRCNLDCAGCYSNNYQRNSLADASLDSFKHALYELGRAGLKNLVVSGGEPFLRDDLAEMMEYAKRKCGIGQINVLSNGTLLQDVDLSPLVGCVDRISVSFDGCSPESTAFIRKEQRFDELVEAVKTIQEAGIPSHIIATIHAKNFEDMASYSALAEELGITLSLSLLSCPADPGGLEGLLPDDAMLKALGKQLFELGSKEKLAVQDAPVDMNINVRRICEAGRKVISVSADGTVYPCHMLHVDDLAMGNLFVEGIEDIIHGGLSMMFDTLGVEDFDDCKECGYKWICGGGCRARSFASSGDLHSKDGYCSMITEFYGGLGERLNAMYAASERG